MALKTDYKDDVFAGNRKYTRVSNEDGTFSFLDVTNYTMEGDVITAEVLNTITGQINANTDEMASEVIDYTLNKSNWSSGIYTISDSRITATSNQELIPGKSITAAQLNALQAANIQDNAQSAGQIKIKAFGTVPTINLPIRIIFRGRK